MVLERERWNGTCGMEWGEVVALSSCVLKQVILEVRLGVSELQGRAAVGLPQQG